MFHYCQCFVTKDIYIPNEKEFKYTYLDIATILRELIISDHNLINELKTCRGITHLGGPYEKLGKKDTRHKDTERGSLQVNVTECHRPILRVIC